MIKSGASAVSRSMGEGLFGGGNFNFPFRSPGVGGDGPFSFDPVGQRSFSQLTRSRSVFEDDVGNLAANKLNTLRPEMANNSGRLAGLGAVRFGSYSCTRNTSLPSTCAGTRRTRLAHARSRPEKNTRTPGFSPV